MVLDGGSLLHFFLGGDGQSASLWAGELSRNRLLGTGTATPGPLLSPQESLLSLDDFCLNGGSQGEEYASRPDLVTTGEPSSAPLVIFEAQGGSLGARATISRSFVVENEYGAETGLIRSEGSGASRQLALLHNTFSALQGPLVAGDGGSDSRLVAARNLYAEAPDYELGASWSSVELTLEAMPDPTGWASGVGVDGIVGPALSSTSSPFTPVAEVVGWSSCERVMAACPNITDCGSLMASGIEQECALDRARSYLTSSSSAAALENPWPWENSAFVSGGPASVPGATGWTCSELSGPWDLLGPGPLGDGDGWSSTVDCDNEDASVIPSLPDPNGIDSPDCIELAGDCYSCPDGSNIIGGGDDDDTGSALDCADTPDSCVPTGCLGCGVPLVAGPGVALLPLLLLPLGLRRRR